MRAALAVLWLLVPAALAAPAVADDSDEALTEAKRQFQLATTSYDSGDYEQALAAFEKARALKPLPGFLFNIGQCHRKLGRHEEAVRFFEQYVAESPSAKNRAEVDALLAEERALVAAAAPTEPTTTPAAQPTPEPLAAEVTPPAAAVDEGTPTWVWAAIGGGALVVVGTVAAIALLPSPSAASLGRVDLRGAQ